MLADEAIAERGMSKSPHDSVIGGGGGGGVGVGGVDEIIGAMAAMKQSLEVRTATFSLFTFSSVIYSITSSSSSSSSREPSTRGLIKSSSVWYLLNRLLYRTTGCGVLR